MSEPTDGVVLQFPSARGKARTRATPVDPEPVLADPEKALFDVPPSTSIVRVPAPVPNAPTRSAKPRAKASPQRPQPKQRQQHSPEHKRALEITAIYKMTQPVCDEAKAAFAIRTAILSSLWADEDIVAAAGRVADSGYPLTSNSLSYQLQRGKAAEREVDPVIHQSIAAALEHLGRLDSETMTEVEQTLAAALRSVCVAVMHQAAGPGTNPA